MTDDTLIAHIGEGYAIRLRRPCTLELVYMPAPDQAEVVAEKVMDFRDLVDNGRQPPADLADERVRSAIDRLRDRAEEDRTNRAALSAAQQSIERVLRELADRFNLEG